jgi:hypothetical protein
MHPKPPGNGGPELVFCVIVIIGLVLSVIVQVVQSRNQRAAESMTANEKVSPAAALVER